MNLKTNKTIVSNGIWSISALAVLQSTLQLIVYPSINKHIGVEKFGDVLYIMALVSIFAPAIGNAVGNVKLMDENSLENRGGNFLLPLGIQTGFGIIVLFFLCNQYVGRLSDWILLVSIFELNILRCYGETAYRLQLDFKGYFIYYLVLSLGYFIGLSLLLSANNWMYCFLIGELLCVLLSVYKDKLFCSLSVSTQWREINKQSALLMVSYLMNYSIGFLDRILLQQWVENTAVSIYYVASLFGKTVIMIIVPLNNMLLAYLAREKCSINSHKYFMTFLGVMAVGMTLYFGIMIASPMFVKIFYSELYELVCPFLWIASLSQIFCAAASTLLTILLKICGIKWQFYFQLIYFIQYISLCAVGSKLKEIEGFAIGGAIANMIQLMIVLCIGIFLINKIKMTKKE